MDYLSLVAENIGISIGLLLIIIIWSFVWKLLALWKSARKGQVVWFIVLAIINTIGILEILYIYVFSDLGKKSKAKPVKKVRKK